VRLRSRAAGYVNCSRSFRNCGWHGLCHGLSKEMGSRPLTQSVKKDVAETVRRRFPFGHFEAKRR